MRVVLTVQDFEAAVAFYRDALGFEQIADWSGEDEEDEWKEEEEEKDEDDVGGWREGDEPPWGKDEADKDAPCTQTIELLLANKGKLAKVELQDKTLFTGVIHDVLVERTPTALTPMLAELLSSSRPPRTFTEAPVSERK